jgi:putative oxidoreductase
MIDRLIARFDAPLSLLARLLMATLFLMAGVAQIGDVRGFAQGLAADGVPIVLGGLVFWVLILGGLLTLLGWATRLVALVLAGFCMLSGVMAYADLAEPTDMLMLLKNIALSGGFLALALHGPGAWSMDAWIARLSRDPA